MQDAGRAGRDRHAEYHTAPRRQHFSPLCKHYETGKQHGELESRDRTSELYFGWPCAYAMPGALVITASGHTRRLTKRMRIIGAIFARNARCRHARRLQHASMATPE